MIFRKKWAESVGHALDDLHAAVGALQGAGIQGEDGCGEDATQLLSESLRKGDRRSDSGLDLQAIPLFPSSRAFSDGWSKPDFLDGRLQEIDGGQQCIGRQQFLELHRLLVTQIVAVR